MRPGQMLAGLVFVGGACVLQKLAAVKMGIRTDADSQKAVAIEAGIDESQFARKLQDKEPFTFRDFDRLPVEVQRAALLEMLASMGLPERVKRYLPIVHALMGEQKRSA